MADWWTTPWAPLSTRDRLYTLLASVPSLALSWWFWRQRSIDPLTAPALLLDRTFQVLTATTALAVVLLLVGAARIALYSAVLIGFVGLTLGAAVVVGGIIRPPADPAAIVVGVASFVLSGWSLIRYTPRVPQLRSTPAGAVAFILGAAVPLLQFWNGAAFLPARTEATLTQSVEAAVVDTVDDEFRVALSYDAENPTTPEFSSS